MRTTRSSAGRIRDLLGSAGEFAAQPLEPRTLMAYLADPIGQAFDVPTELFQLQAPVGAVVANFGWTSVALGDLNGDGTGDFAVSAPGRISDDSGPAVNGAVFVYSGANRAVITTLQGTQPLFGFTLLSLGDLTGDGKDEIAVGSPQESLVRVYSAASGNLQRTFTGDASSEFGYALALQSNSTGGQDPGIIIGAPSMGGGGAVYAFALDTGVERFRADGPVAGSRFGHAVAGVVDSTGDLEDFVADGLGEVVVGAPAGSDGGRVYLLTGADGLVIGSMTSTDGFGSALLGVAGGSYVLVGDPGQDGAGGRVATVYTYSYGAGITLAEYNSFQGTEESFGSTIHSIGNIDGRSGDEFAVGAPSVDGSTAAFHVMAYSSPGSPLVRQPGPGTSGAIGFGALGDINGDGFADVLRAGLTAEGDPIATGYSSLAYFGLQRPNVVSRDGTFLIYSGPDASGGSWGSTEPLLSAVKYAVRNGEVIALSSLPGVGTDFEIAAIGDDGTIAGYTTTGPTQYSWEVPQRLDTIIIVDGERFSLAGDDYIAAIQGPTDINVANFNFKRVGPTGDLLIEEATPYPGTPRAWVLTGSDHILIFLWNGYVEDQSTDGMILGAERADQTVTGETRLWTRAGGKVAVTKFFNAGRINDDHEVFGIDHNGDLAVLRANKITRVARASDIVPGADYASWTVLGIDKDGRGIARLDWYDYGQTRYENGYFTYLIEDDNQLVRLDSLIALGTPPTGLWEDTREAPRDAEPAQITVLNDGSLLVNSTLLTQVDSSEGLVADTRGVRSVSAGPSGMRAVAVNPDGIPISFRLVGNEWQGRSLSGLAGTLSIDGDLAVFVDPKDGQTYAVTLGRVLDGEDEGNGTVTLYREQVDGTFSEPRTLNDTTFASSAIVTRLTVFVSADNRVHIVGLNQSGQLVMFYQTGQRLADDATKWEWFFENVELTQLAPNGQTTPQWVDELTVYVAPWNGLNIAGLTASGDAEVVWWAPSQKNWSTDNLSKITGLTPLVGGLTSYVTGWGGLNVAGIDTNGDLQVVWWVPGFGNQWRANNMTTEFDGQKLDPLTVSSYVTPWGGLNVAGIDVDTGEAVVYWWAPELTDWTAEALTFNRDPQDPLPTGRLLAVNNGQQLNLFGRADSGEVIRLYWNPGDGSVWGLQNLTRIAT